MMMKPRDSFEDGVCRLDEASGPSKDRPWRVHSRAQNLESKSDQRTLLLDGDEEEDDVLRFDRLPFLIDSSSRSQRSRT